MDRTGDKTILVVDDSAAYADNLQQILTGAGYRVLLATSRDAAMKLTDAENFCVAILDSRLPDGDGASLARALKARRPQAEMILFTSVPLLGPSLTMLKPDVWACVAKPCPTEELLLLVQEAEHQATLQEEKRELSERVLIAENLAAAGRVSAGLSHEIRNPLNSTSLQLSLLERRVRRLPKDLQPEILEPIGAVREEIQRLNRLVEEFLDFARPREFAPAPVDLTALAEHVRILLEPQALESGIRLECHSRAACVVLGEVDRLRQAVLNLALNAIQATPAGGSVRLEVGEAGGEIFLAVEDTGPGIPGALRPRIFEPFYTTKPKGTGLGLPIVYSIVRRHGGNLTLDENRPRGARFVMRFARPPAP